MKKFLTVALASCFALSGCIALAACDQGTDYDHTIVFYSSQGQNLTPVTDIAIQSFEEKYPGWKVQHTQPGGYDEVLDKVRSDLTAGLQPDLAYCYADHVAQYIESGKVVEMNKYLTNSESYTYKANGESKTIDRIGFTDEDVAKFIPSFMEEGYARNYTGYSGDQDALLTLPFVKSTELLYYNPKALATLQNVAEDKVTPPATWDELWDLCEKARNQTGWENCTPLGYDSEANWFITMSEQMDFGYTSVDANNHYLFNNEGAKAWLAEVAGYYEKGYITTQQIYGGQYTSSLFIKGPEDGGLVFCIGSSGGANNQAGSTFTTEVAPIPGVDADHNDCISQGPSLVMLTGGNGVKDSNEKEIMTFQFIKELLDVEFQAKFSQKSGYNPMRSDVYELASFKKFINENKDPDTDKALSGANLVVSKAVKAGQSLTGRYFTSPAFVGSSTARAQMTSVVQYCLLGQKKPDRALADAIKACGGSVNG